jgi:hypothetical protein
MQTPESLERQLDSFTLPERQAALKTLMAMTKDAPIPGANVNMHFHSFFSYNAKGWSPSRIAWESRKAGLQAAALCDFDVLDGMEEFIDAGLTVGLRTAVHVETRAYLKEYAQAEINSPGEPGVTYIMGGGFVRMPAAGSETARTLQYLRDQAAARNQALVRRINPHMGPSAVDYDKDVVPLSPGRCPTERHLVRAYVMKSRAVFPVESAWVDFWVSILGKEAAEVRKLAGNPAALEERVRGRLVKQGGFGYEPPTVKSFPSVDDFVQWVRACDAVPMAAWLDGTSEGERDPGTLLECLRAKGVAAVNIIPDRNWNYADPAVRTLKSAKLKDYVEAAEALAMPINIGTEMNRDGLPFVDDLDGDALKSHRELFVRGAQVMVGHGILSRYAGVSYVGGVAAKQFGADIRGKDTFFAAVGALPALTRSVADKLVAAGPVQALDAIRKAAANGKW